MAVVTISRMPGALGDEVAEMLAQRLGYRLVGNRELARLLSAGYGTGPHPWWVHSPAAAERSPSFRESLTVDASSYRRALRHVMLDLVAEDRVVIVGLGAGQLLQGLGHLMRHLLVAPDEIRWTRLMAKSAV